MLPPSRGAPGRQCAGCTALDGAQCTKSASHLVRDRAIGSHSGPAGTGALRTRGVLARACASRASALWCWVTADDQLFARVLLRVPEQPTHIRVPRVHPSALLLGHLEGGSTAEILSAAWECVIPELSNSIFPHAVNTSRGLMPVVLSQHRPARNKVHLGPMSFLHLASVFLQSSVYLSISADT